MNGFINLSREKSKNLDSVVFKNSKNLHKDALILAANHSYSTASSLLILSLEECIKAQYILLYAEGIDVYKTQRANKIFTSHTERHDVAKSLEMVLGIFEIIDKLFSPVEKFNNSSSTGLLNIARFINSFVVILQTRDRIRSIGNFNKMKNNGFYVDYLEKVMIPDEIVRKEEFAVIQDIYVRVSKNYKLLKLFTNNHILEKYFKDDSGELKRKVISTINQHVNSKIV